MSLTSVGFNPYLQTCNAFDHAFPVKAKGWGVVSWDCDLIYDDEFKTSCVRIRRNASMTPYGGDEPVCEGLEVEGLSLRPLEFETTFGELAGIE